LKQWGDPENNIPGDIFGDNETKTAVNNWQNDYERLHQGLLLILGHQHENIFSPEFDKKFAQQKNLLEWSLNSWANLRHKGFHFNGRDKFIQMLSGIELPKDADAKDALTKLWQTDQSARQMRLKDALLGSHCEDYLTQDQLRKIYTEVTPEQPSELPMPRFNRILTRVENKKAWHKFNLPKPAKERLLNKSPALLCQYSCLKMLYQSGFLNWFAQISPASLRNWIEIAVKAADDEAKALNENKTSKIYGQFIQAKSRKIGDVAKVENFTLNEFLFYLSGQTAAEFQVQKNVYHSNGEKAMEQAAYLENIKCDVVIQAFAAYLTARDGKGANFAFLLKLSQESVKIAHQSQVKNLSVNLAPASGEDWQKSLYFMLHFVPAGFASTLYHQLKKWHILADKGDLPAHQDRNKSDPDTKLFKQLAAVMVLYLDMHDANFDGTGAPTGSEKLIDLFEDKRAFQRVFPNVTANPNASQQAGEKSITLPRGLREFLRFGFHGKIMDSLQNSKITHQDLDRLAELQPKIDKTQQSLDKIHLDWADAEKKKDFGRYHQNDLKDYERHLKLQSEYRQLKNRVNLTYHLHLHQLLMEILARLVDYASLWERDQIFLLLALAHQHGHSSMNDFFSVITDENGRVQDGFALFADGRVVEARDNLVKTAANKNDPKLTAFAQKLDKFIPLNQRNKRSNRSIRNYFMHFNMLRDKKPKANKVPVKEPLDLMSWLNQARELMSYDRKLKNAVAKSIIELFERHNISIGWDADADHQLINPRLKNQRITHLGGLTIIQTGGKHDKKGFKITEWMHNEDYLKMICAMLNIAYIPPPPRVKK
ncbi:MAG: type VI-A CRISPR-associated RNA-guided ribonuclease Cas13a, partial [Alphaproteobacteria bacterium]|nr:type VI-A CRISPR-associated RNA-guided ribonuclease Cas13a [Alphaproteobacteria bacterium]